MNSRFGFGMEFRYSYLATIIAFITMDLAAAAAWDEAVVLLWESNWQSVSASVKE